MLRVRNPLLGTKKTLYLQETFGNKCFKQSGSLSIWFDPEMVWTPPSTGKPGRQQQFRGANIRPKNRMVSPSGKSRRTSFNRFVQQSRGTEKNGASLMQLEPLQDRRHFLFHFEKSFCCVRPCNRVEVSPHLYDLDALSQQSRRSV
jgi:hypothetical protein